MRKRTTTVQINTGLSMMEVTKAECYDKNTREITAMEPEVFTENLEFLNESGLLSNALGWNYERNPETNGEYIIETSRMNPESDVILTFWVRLKDGVSSEDLENILRKVEVEE